MSDDNRCVVCWEDNIKDEDKCYDCSFSDKHWVCIECDEKRTSNRCEICRSQLLLYYNTRNCDCVEDGNTGYCGKCDQPMPTIL